jgi:hypothetical protein
MKTEIICPLCGGSGRWTKVRNIEMRKLVYKLRAKGLTYREIMKATGLKSTAAVHYYCGAFPQARKWYGW